MEKLIKGSLASGIETARKVNEIVDWINEKENLTAEFAEKPQNRRKEPRGKALYWTILTLENFIKNEPEDSKWMDIDDCKDFLKKLEALQRLKDKGFVWQGWEESALDNGMCIVGIQIPEDNWETDVVRDLDLLFGGDE